MVRTEYFGMYLCVFQTCSEVIAHYKIVNAPPDVLLTGLEPVRPPGVDVGLVRIEISECISETGVKQIGELTALLVGKPRVLTVAFGILQVYFLVSDIEVAADYHTFAESAGTHPRDVM